MSTMPELRATSTGELRSRIPGLERTATGPKTANAAQAAGAELRRIAKVLDERETAQADADAAQTRAATAWERVATLEAELSDARAIAREAEADARASLRTVLGA